MKTTLTLCLMFFGIITAQAQKQEIKCSFYIVIHKTNF